MALTERIQSGVLKPGDHLPSEAALSQDFGVSRHTVRVALRALYERGLVASRQGVGTVVLTAPIEPRFTYTLQSIDDLLQYAATTPRRVLTAKRVAADAPLAEWLDCPVGAVWWVTRTAREDNAQRGVIASSRIYVPDAFGAAITRLRTSTLPLFAILEEEFGVHVAEVTQTLSVGAAEHDEAKTLGIDPGAPVMCVVRRFVDADGQVLEVARSVHPAERFQYAMTVRLTKGA